MRKTVLYCVVVIAIMFAVIVANAYFFFMDEDTLTYIMAGVGTVTIALIFWWQHRKTNKQVDAMLQEVIPENVGARSYIDENTETIFLRSHDYHTRGGQEWIVSPNAITVSLNYNPDIQTIPISKIQTIDLSHGEPVSQMSFSILGVRQYMVGNLVEDHVESVQQGLIQFHVHDIPIARAVRSRVANG